MKKQILFASLITLLSFLSSFAIGQTANFTVNNNSQCLSGNSFVLTNTSTGTGLTYTWSFGNGGTSTVTSPAYSYTAAGTYTITLTATGTTGSNSTAKVVTVKAMPAAIAGLTTVCVGQSTTLTNATGGGTWSGSAPSVVSVVSGSGVITGLSSGTANITYTSNGCRATRVQSVTPLASAGTISGSHSVCMGANTTLSSTVGGGIWTSSNTAVATCCTCPLGAITGISAGTALISYSVTTSCGTATAVYTMTVNPLPVIVSAAMAPVMTGTTIAPLYYSTTGAPTSYSLTWNSAALTAGFSSISSASLATSPMSIAIPGSAAVGSYTATMVVTKGACSSVPTAVTLNVDPAINIYTYAGKGSNGYTGNGGAATAAKLSHPYGIATDCSGNTYVADFENAVVRKIDARGVITTVAGNGIVGYSGNGGPATAAKLSHPNGIALDNAGNLYISDYNNHVIRKVNTAGIISTYAGSSAHGYTGDGGAATSAALYYPIGLAVDNAGNLFIADHYNNVIRKVNTSGIITTVAGNGVAGYSGNGGAATAAKLAYPRGVAVDAAGNLYITDYSNQVIRMVNTSGTISTIAGTTVSGNTGTGGLATSARIYNPYGIAVDAAGNVYFSELGNHQVRKISAAGIITKVAGLGASGYSGDGGIATSAKLFQPMGVAVNCDGNVLISDNANYAVRIVGEYNRTPYFLAGNSPLLEICGSGSAISLDSILTVNDFDTTQSIAWTAVTSPAHGTLSAAYGTTSTGSTLIPAGLTYTPATGYSGSDAFVVTVTDGIATTATTVNVMVATSVDAGTISGASSVCGAGTTTLSSSVTGGVWSSSDLSVATISTSGVVSGVAPGTTVISYTVTNGCGTAIATTTLNVDPSPVAGTINGAASVCLGSTVIYTDSISGGTWSSSNTGIATVSGTGAVTGVGVGIATITYTVTNSCGTAYTLRDITVQLMPVVPAITGPSAVCVGSTIDLNNATPHGAWYSSNTAVATVNIVSGIVTGVDEGTAIITYTVHNACGVVSNTKVVSVNPASVAVSPVTGTAVVCPGATTTLTSATTGGTWSSSTPSLATVNSTTGVITGVSTGTLSITYTVTTACGSSVATKVVSVNPLANPGTISGVVSICAGYTVSLTASISGGVWSSGNTAIGTVTSTGMVTGISGGLAPISYTKTNSCGSVSAVVNVPVNTLPPVDTISGAATLCAGSTITLANGTALGMWTSNNTAVAAVTSSGVVTGIAGGTATISYTVHNGCGYSSAIKVVSVNPLPYASSIAGVSVIYEGNTATMTNTVSGGTWSSSNTAAATIGSTGIITAVAPGTTTITYTISNSCGTTSAYAVITILELAPITGPNVVAVGSTITLSDTSNCGLWSSSDPTIATIDLVTGVVTGITPGTVTITYSVGPVFVTYVVTVITSTPIMGPGSVCLGGTIALTNSTSGGVWSSSTPAVATISSTGIVSGEAAGVTTISYTAGSITITKAVTVNVGPAITGVSYPCVGSTITMSASASGGTWSSSSASTVTVGAATGLVTGVSAGAANITYTLPSGCYAVKPVTVNTLLAATATGTNISCNGGANGSVDLTVSGGSSSYTYNWSNGATTQDLSGIGAGSYSVVVSDAFGCSATASAAVTQPSAALNASASTTANVSCNGGSNGAIDLTISGGTTSYNYSWSNGATSEDLTGLSAGAYNVTVTDANGCTATASATVTQPSSALNASVTGFANISCNGGSNGSIDLAVSGGAGTYTYNWSNGATTQDITGVTAGTYSVTVTDANSCIATAAATLTQPSAAISASAATTANVLCNGGSNGAISLTVSGGAGSYVYSWSNGATTQNISGIAAGSYSVTVTDANGCTDVAFATVTQPVIALAASATTISNVTCNGGSNGSIDLTVSGGTGTYTYGWSNDATGQDLGGLPAGTYTVTVTDANGCTATASATVTEPASALSASAATTSNVSCHGGANGAIALSVSGGTASYTYNWSNGATTQNLSGLSAGSYSVTVTDASGCSATASATVTQPSSALNASAATTSNVSCNGGANGTIALSVSGGTTSYTYNWSNGATTQNLGGLSAGSYSVTVTDANGCTATASATVTQPSSALSASAATTSNVFCFGESTGAIALTVSGGVATYSYNWSNGSTTANLTGATAGTYSVTVTDANGCTATASATITQPSSGLTASAATTSNVMCNGGSNGTITLSTGGGVAPYNYTWSNGATTQNLSGLSAGAYSVSVTDASGCSATASVTVTQPSSALNASAAITSNVSCNGGANGAIALSVSGGTASYTYNWSNGATTQNLSGLAAGSYSVTVTDANGCSATASASITQPASALAASAAITSNVSCNGGANGTIALSVSGGTTSYTYNWSNGATTQNLSGLAAGSYSVTVTDANGCTATASATVTQPSSALSASAATTSNVSCNGGANGAIALSVSGGTASYTYNWSNGATTQNLSGLAAGSYSVTVTDANGCSAT
ncbi:MAG: Ig-like domain-containing protein, partial [Bacteroidota bacterium]